MTKFKITTVKSKEEEDAKLFASAEIFEGDAFGGSDVESDIDDQKAHSNLINDIGKISKRKKIGPAPRNIRALAKEGGTEVDSSDILKRIGQKSLTHASKKIRTLPKPPEKVALRRLKRAAGYEKVSMESEKWSSLVHKRRVQEQLTFPLQNPNISIHNTLKTEEVKMQTPLEQEVYALLQGAKLMEDNKLTNEELARKRAMSLEELKERNRLAWREKQQKRRIEMKAWRENKNKSRKFHRHLRRDRLKKEKAELEQLEKTNPEAALERLEELEKARVRERMTLRHKHSKWAHLQGFRATRDLKAMTALQENRNMHQELTAKRKREESSSEDEEENIEEKLEALKKEREAAIKAGLFDPSNPWTANLMHQVPDRLKITPESAIDDSFVNFKKFWDEVNRRRMVERKAQEEAEAERKKAELNEKEDVYDNEDEREGVNDEHDVTDDEEKPAVNNDTELNMEIKRQVKKKREVSEGIKKTHNTEKKANKVKNKKNKKDVGIENNGEAAHNLKKKKKAGCKTEDAGVESVDLKVHETNEGKLDVARTKKAKKKKTSLTSKKIKKCCNKDESGDKKKKVNKKLQKVVSENVDGAKSTLNNQEKKGTLKKKKSELGTENANLTKVNKSNSKKSKKKEGKKKNANKPFANVDTEYNKEYGDEEENEVRKVMKEKVINANTQDNDNLEEQLISIDSMFNQAEIALRQKLKKKLERLGMSDNADKEWTKVISNKEKKKKKNDISENHKSSLPSPEEFDFALKNSKDNIDEGIERAQTLEDMDELQMKSESLEPLQRASNTLLASSREKTVESSKVNEKTAAPKVVQVDPSKFIEVDAKKLLTAMPDTITQGDEGMDDDDNEEEEAEDIIREAFADDYLVNEFKSEKDAAREESKPKSLCLALPGWGNWTGPNIKMSKRHRKRYTIRAPKAPSRKDDTLGNVIYDEKSDVHPNLRKVMVNELPFSFSSVKEFEASIRAPVGRMFIPEKQHQNLTAPPVVTKMGTVIEPMTEEELLKHDDIYSKQQKPWIKPGRIDKRL
ncbi:U3 small nucleolar RNA-associated protein 14 A [Halocaridina rubra]|uniref:U3 small nucleolar RNA-associated protein 14 A n=1 Tax=Halocaridina rubra TaxID=373956 RepID=A0AAN9AE39_HALRR